MKQRRKHDIFMVYMGSLVFVFLLGISIAYTLAAPSVAPPGGSGAISAAPNGNVGIGFWVGIAPTQKLDVNGNIKAAGLCIGSDCRSAWPSSGPTRVANAGSGGAAQAVCPSGKKLTGGGCTILDGASGNVFSNCRLVRSGPWGGAPDTTWQCQWKQRGSSSDCGEAGMMITTAFCE